MNTVSLIGSVSRNAGGLFESVRRLHQVLLGPTGTVPGDTERARNHNAGITQVSVLALRDPFSKVDALAWQPVPVRCFRVYGPRHFGYSPVLARKLRQANADLVHVHGLWQFLSIAANRWHRQFRRPYVVSPHGMLDTWALKNSAIKKRFAWRMYEQKHLRQAACLRALCPAEVTAIRALGLRNPVCLIPNGIDLPELDRAPKGQTGHRPAHQLAGRRILLYLGRIHPKKGLRELLNGWAEAERPKNWLLVIAGWSQGGHEEELKRLADQLGIRAAGDDIALGNGSVVFVGPQFGSAKRQWLDRCLGLILPSFSEGVPMVVLEAWASAKPTLMTAACNLPAGFAEGAAFQVQPERGSIRRGLEQFFKTSSPELEQMGIHGRDLVARDFSWPKIASELESVYRWLCSKGTKPGCIVND